MLSKPKHVSRYTGFRLTDIGFGAGFSIWSLRACATGHGNCPCVVEGMSRALGPLGDEGRVHGVSLAWTLSEFGRRTIHLAAPGCLGVTYDEVAFIAALDAAQSQDSEHRDAQLSWLLRRQPAEDVSDAAQRFASLMSAAGHRIRQPRSLRDDNRDKILGQI